MDADYALLRGVGYPQESGERVYLEDDLTRIGCIGLINKPWFRKFLWEFQIGMT